MDLLFGYFLMLVVPISFIGIFLAAPFWIAKLTNGEQDDIINESKKYEGKEREKFTEVKREEKRFKEYESYIYGGGVLFFMVIVALFSGELSYPGKDPVVTRTDNSDVFSIFVGITFVFGAWLMGYGLIGKLKSRKAKASTPKRK